MDPITLKLTHIRQLNIPYSWYYRDDKGGIMCCHQFIDKSCGFITPEYVNFHISLTPFPGSRWARFRDNMRIVDIQDSGLDSVLTDMRNYLIQQFGIVEELHFKVEAA